MTKPIFKLTRPFLMRQQILRHIQPQQSACAASDQYVRPYMRNIRLSFSQVCMAVAATSQFTPSPPSSLSSTQKTLFSPSLLH